MRMMKASSIKKHNADTERSASKQSSTEPSPMPTPRTSWAPVLGPQPRFGIIGCSDASAQGKETWKVATPFGECMITAMDSEKRVLFANRNYCTKLDADGKPQYAPPHEVNTHAICWALGVECKCSGGILALGNAGTLHPETVPVGSVLMADDYYRVRPAPLSTFWGNEKVGAFAVPDGDGVGRVHCTPADPSSEQWLDLRKVVQEILQPMRPSDQVKLAEGQTPESWPCIGDHKPGDALEDSAIYVQTEGPRCETRAEVRHYKSLGHIVGMTCGREWALTEELCLPYVLLCFCDSACNGLSAHPQGSAGEREEHAEAAKHVASTIIEALVTGLPKAKAPEPLPVAEIKKPFWSPW